MGDINIGQHLDCFNYGKDRTVEIEFRKITDGTRNCSVIVTNTVVFILDGKMMHYFKDSPKQLAEKGHILFIPSGTSYYWCALTDVDILVFKVYESISLCMNYTIEKLYDEKIYIKNDKYEPEVKYFGMLEIRPRLWCFLNGTSDCLTDGLICRCWFDLKIREFFLLLRSYYSKEDVRKFLFPILSKDVAFSESVRRYWRNFRTVQDLAEFLHMTPKQFSTRFVTVFGRTPYKWMIEGRANIIHHEITTTDKMFKQIALENEFPSVSSFTHFCKTIFGKTPSQLREEI